MIELKYLKPIIKNPKVSATRAIGRGTFLRRQPVRTSKDKVALQSRLLLILSLKRRTSNCLSHNKYPKIVKYKILKIN